MENPVPEVPSSRSLPMARDVENFNNLRYQQEQQRIERNREAKRIEEHTNKKIVLTDLMLQKYYEKLNELALYTRQKQLEKAQAEQGRIIDLEVK